MINTIPPNIINVVIEWVVKTMNTKKQFEK